MIHELSGATSALVKVALDANLQSQRLSANNIANANSKGYQTVGVDFKSLYQEAESILAAKHEQSVSQFDDLRGELRSGDFIQRANTDVSLDMEMLRLNEVVVQYQSLLKALGKYGGLVKMAINGEQAR